MFRWRKLGRVFNPLDVKNKTWLKEFAQAPYTLMFDDFVRVYFCCRPMADEHGQYASYSGFIDLNKSNLFEILRISEKPILKLGELGTFDEFGTYPTSVVRVENQIYVYYGGWTRCESVPFNVGIGLAISRNDGVTFKKYGKGPILPYTPDEPFVMSGPKITRFDEKFYLFYIAGKKWVVVNNRPEPVYKIRMATSTDGISWKKLNRDIIESRIEPDEAQASPDVIFSNGKYHMFFCFRYSTGYRGKEKGYRIGYASSKDILNWTRNDKKAGIDVSEFGWDEEMVSYPHVFELDDITYMLYLGNQVGRFGFGLAQLEGNLI